MSSPSRWPDCGNPLLLRPAPDKGGRYKRTRLPMGSFRAKYTGKIDFPFSSLSGTFHPHCDSWDFAWQPHAPPRVRLARPIDANPAVITQVCIFQNNIPDFFATSVKIDVGVTPNHTLSSALGMVSNSFVSNTMTRGTRYNTNNVNNNH